MNDTSLVSQLIKHALISPDRAAIKHYVKGQLEAISYLELTKLVIYYREKILKLGISENSKIVICLENSPEYLAVLYACWSLKLTVIPLHSQSKAREVKHIINFTGAKLIIALDINPLFKQIESQALKLKGEELTANYSVDEIILLEKNCLDINPSQTALILFTSGTTGNPKGVMLSHKNLTANTLSIIEYLKLQKEDEIYCVLPFTYSYGNSVLQTHIYVGACIHIGQSMVYPQKVAEGLMLPDITGFSGVPSTFQILLHKTSFSKKPPNLRYITQAGGAMNINTTNQLLQLLPQTDIFVMYGQTEAAARLSYLPPGRILDKIGSIGTAIPSVILSIVDETGLHLSDGQVGEIVAKGENIMQGYWHNPEATEATLKDGWLHTGDLGYKDEDGFIFIKGRKKQMIKSGANRIHPEEIEEVISECPAVAEVAVTGMKDELLGEVIGAFIVAKDNHKTDDKAIRIVCRQNLPSHKQPKFIFWATELPKTSSGKIQRHLLTDTYKQTSKIN